MNIFENKKKRSFSVLTVTAADIEMEHREKSLVFSILYVVSGECTLSVNQHDYSAKPGYVANIFITNTVSISHASPDFKCRVLNFNNAIMKEVVARVESYVMGFLVKERVRIVDNEMFHRYLLNAIENVEILQQWNDSHENMHYDQVVCLVRSVLGLIIDYARFHADVPTGNYNCLEAHFRSFISILSEHYKESREVVYFAELLNLSPKYLNYICRKVAGSGCKVIIDGFIIEQIKNELKMSEKNIQEIAYEYGFSSQSFFGSYFKRYVGKGPKAYRDELAELKMRLE